MSSSYWRNQIKQIESKLKTLRSRHSREVGKVANLERDISRLQRQAGQTNSDSMRRHYLRSLENKQKDLVRAKGDEAKVSSDIGGAETKLADARGKLAAAEASERKQAEQKAERERRQQERQAKERERRAEQTRRRAEREQQMWDTEQQMRDVERDRQIELLAHRATELETRLAEQSRQAAPPEITVLFLAASPEDQEPLRIDKENREIQKRVRASDYRESIWFDSRPARQLGDLIQDLNEVQPDILHFSGHSDQDSLVFEDDDGNTTELTNDQLGRLLSTGGGRIRLAIFNSCHSEAQAKMACDHIDLAIGMNTSIGDETAKTFAGQFYNSLGFGKSVAEAYRQATLQVELEHGEDHDVPQLFAADGVDPETVVLVNPDET